MIAASSGSGWWLVAPARPYGALLLCEVLGPGVVWPREREYLAALVGRRLADHVGGRPKPVQAEPGRVAGQLERAVADQPAAQERGGLLVGELVRKGQAVALVGDGPLGVAAVDIAAGEARVQAEVLAVRRAEAAGAVGPAEPGHADSSAVLGAADDLVSEHDRELGRLESRCRAGGDRCGTPRTR